ncbi:hypothetical protein BDY24DRAFT_415588 [Mrakia frigida]|uniref:uncharacterized protein n=1 Tax=Mrakia frigida TaxID=29902 RepID=UPI003FCBF1DA
MDGLPATSLPLSITMLIFIAKDMVVVVEVFVTSPLPWIQPNQPAPSSLLLVLLLLSFFLFSIPPNSSSSSQPCSL